jgi:hypothetical protein
MSGPEEAILASSSSAHSCPALVIHAYVSVCLQRQSASLESPYMRYIHQKRVRMEGLLDGLLTLPAS